MDDTVVATDQQRVNILRWTGNLKRTTRGLGGEQLFNLPAQISNARFKWPAARHTGPPRPDPHLAVRFSTNRDNHIDEILAAWRQTHGS